MTPCEERSSKKIEPLVAAKSVLEKKGKCNTIVKYYYSSLGGGGPVWPLILPLLPFWGSYRVALSSLRTKSNISSTFPPSNTNKDPSLKERPALQTALFKTYSMMC
jgi:hypothetical protein